MSCGWISGISAGEKALLFFFDVRGVSDRLSLLFPQHEILPAMWAQLERVGRWAGDCEINNSAQKPISLLDFVHTR